MLRILSDGSTHDRYEGYARNTSMIMSDFLRLKKVKASQEKLKRINKNKCLETVTKNLLSSLKEPGVEQKARDQSCSEM